MSRTTRAYLQLAAAMAIVGSSVVAGKMVITAFPVCLASELRFLIALAVLLPMLLRAERGFPRIRKADWAVMFLQAFFGTFLFSIFLLYGLKFTTAAEAGVITSTTPAVAGLTAFLVLREKITSRNVFALALAVVGILVLNLSGADSLHLRGPRPWLGNIMVFGAVVGEALFISCGKMVSRRLSPLTISTVVSLYGAAMFLPFALADLRGFDLTAVATVQWLPVVYFGLIVTVAAFMLWYSGLAVIPANQAAVFTGVLPVSAVLLSYLVLGEAFLWTHLAGMACVLGALAVITRRS